MVDETNTAVSASYDATMIVWDLTTLQNAKMLFGPHKDAIMDFDWKNSLLVSGDRSGNVAFWVFCGKLSKDINSGKQFKKQKSHTGAVSKCLLYSDGLQNNLIITVGINDGAICIHDMRDNKHVFQQQIHGGAIADVTTNMSSFSRGVFIMESCNWIGG